MALTKLNNQSLNAVTTAGIPIRTGSVLQTVTNTSNSTVSEATTNLEDLLTISITPQFANSIIQIEAYVGVLQVSAGSSNAYGQVVLSDPQGNQLFRAVTGQAGYNTETYSLFGIHSPNSTSQQTYKISISTSSGGTSNVSTDGQRYSIRAMEIAG